LGGLWAWHVRETILRCVRRHGIRQRVNGFRHGVAKVGQQRFETFALHSVRVPLQSDPAKLGMYWLPNKDCFTKSMILSSVARLFDPLGLNTTVTISG